MEYHFKFSLTPDEFGEWGAYTSWKAPWKKKDRMKYLIRNTFNTAIIMAAALIVLRKINPPKKDHFILLITLFLVALFIVIAIAYYRVPFRMKEDMRKLLAKEENVGLIEEREIIVNEEGLVVSATDKKSHCKWGTITKYAVTRDFFFLYFTSETGLIIPKRLFSSQNEIDEFDNFLMHKIPLSSSFRSMGI